MPTLEQAAEFIAYKIKKYGKEAHCNRIVVMEEVRQEAVENKPDEQGKQKTRIGFETYSPEAYKSWNEMLKYLMERCSCNPLIVVDLIRLLVQMAQREEMVLHGEPMDGIAVALHGLFSVTDYEKGLREAREHKRLQRKGAGNHANTERP